MFYSVPDIHVHESCIPFGQQSLEMAHEPTGVCFKFWVKKSCSCFLPIPRSHVGDVLWSSEPDSRRQFSHCFWSAFLGFRKMRFRTASAKTYHPKHTPEGSSFWPDGISHTIEHDMGWLRLVGSIKLQVSLSKEPYKRDYILQKRPINRPYWP